MSNFAPYPLPENLASWETFAILGHYGSFIASMYSAIGGFTLHHQSEWSGEYLRSNVTRFIEGTFQKVQELKPRYEVNVTLV